MDIVGKMYFSFSLLIVSLYKVNVNSSVIKNEQTCTKKSISKGFFVLTNDKKKKDFYDGSGKIGASWTNIFLFFTSYSITL